MFHLCHIFLWKLNLEGISCAPQDCLHFLVAAPQLFPFLGKSKAPGDAELKVRLARDAGMELWEQEQDITRPPGMGCFPQTTTQSLHPQRAIMEALCAEPDAPGLG